MCHLCGHGPRFAPGKRLPTSLGSDQDSRDSCNACNNNRERIGDGGDAHFAGSSLFEIPTMRCKSRVFTCCRGWSIFGTRRAEFHSRDSQRNWSDTAHSLGLLIALLIMDLRRWHQCWSKNICSSSGAKTYQRQVLFVQTRGDTDIIIIQQQQLWIVIIFNWLFLVLKSPDCEEWTSVRWRNLLALPSKSTLTPTVSVSYLLEISLLISLHLVGALFFVSGSPSSTWKWVPLHLSKCR